jgi:hypothetical protein
MQRSCSDELSKCRSVFPDTVAAGRWFPPANVHRSWGRTMLSPEGVPTMSYKLWSRILFSIVILPLALSYGSAQRTKDTGPKYDVGNEVKLKGVIEDIREIPGNFEGTLLVVKTDTGTVLVRVAPASFLKEIDASFAKGDQVKVVGAKAPNATEEEILAREITVGTNTVTLRDDRGIPVWAGWNPAKTSGK